MEKPYRISLQIVCLRHAGPAGITLLNLACNISNGSQEQMWSNYNEYRTVFLTHPCMTAFSKQTISKQCDSETINPRSIYVGIR